MNDRVVVITGASDGIGAAAAEALNRPGTRVVLVGRSPAKTEAVAASLGVEHHVCDFSSLAQVRQLAQTLGGRHPRIDVLANNAGGVMPRRSVTEDGYETTIQVNYLAPFLLTRLLLPNLRAGDGVVVVTASDAARRGRIDLADLSLARRWTSFGAYANSKLADICFARGMSRRWAGIRAASFHPGVVASNFGSNGPAFVARFYGLASRFMLDSQAGADTLVWLASDRSAVDWENGGYYVRRQSAQFPGQAADTGFVDRLFDATDLILA